MGGMLRDRRRHMPMLGRGMQRPGLGRGLIVVGPHRSGTSAVTGALEALGLHACRQDDRFPPSAWNERGYYESRSLAILDETLLHHLGGAWWAPPDPGPNWARDEGFGALRLEAARLFGEAHSFDQWVWKDPRACVLLPFWDLVLGADMPRLIVLREPEAIAASLEARNQMPREFAIALVERSLRLALRDSAERPVMITAYEDALADADAWCRQVVAFMHQVGLSTAEPTSFDGALDLLDPGLRHHRPESERNRSAGWLWQWAYERRGIHPSLAIHGLPDEAPETDANIRLAALTFTPVTRQTR